MKNWLLLFLLAILLMVMGVQGSLGKVLACLVAPTYVTIKTGEE